ncbi:MAG: hypothetical protein JSV03_05425 [Planctomycetota bacterium]|nr:MAG: hypothetical protein JSV03_05425 [Planctomycetota bacterium]
MKLSVLTIAKGGITIPGMAKKLRILSIGMGFAGCLLGLGCRSGGPEGMPSEAEQREMFSLMLPSQIKIQPFTQIRSFDNDQIPDGILAVIRPLDRFGDPAKAVGLFYFELWTYQKASGDHKGQRLAYWERTIANEDEVKLYWTRAQMYEFQLAWTAGEEGASPGMKFVLTASYRAPWEETMQDEYILDLHVPSNLIKEASAR